MATTGEYIARRSSQSGGRVRRLSSIDATRTDLFTGRNVLVPPKHLMASSNAYETARAMELAKSHLDEDLSSPEITPRAASPVSGEPVFTTDRYAYAFDIDGVLVRGGEAIEDAVEAMRVLNGENEWGVRVPYIFVTNGGGKTEEERCLDLSRQLELEVSPGQFICGHTPMREMAERYHTVLVVGGEGEKCREVAEGYGFKNVVTPGDIIKTEQDTTPFRKLTDEEYSNSRTLNLDETVIEAIFVFADSRDWAGDQQIILDLCMSKGGRIGTRSETFDEGPQVFFSHNDIVWSTSHAHTRIGMGALRASLETVFKAVTGNELRTVAFGKPQLGTFQFATRLLRQWRKENYGIDSAPETVYFVGDTPESDIRGTNEFNQSEECENNWVSILVKTGVFQAGTVPRYPPKKTVNTVLDAVKFGMQREFAKGLKMASLGNGAEHPAVTEAVVD
ncbi:TIGR01456 family HAD hydrolase [Polytolypa hystricis UAMH7299]|uniref:TIGR01456 family HAD hydrolase n=1 Tax=Polytolypa hystricis (strain UAMH7299) TaxID=1447883 RepID=A0A2B7WQI7_POLH7|nr:TIGR01456 family HAD hydrolase [Polytolypa hystricis UAMH7299]